MNETPALYKAIDDLKALNKELYEALKAVQASVICNGDFTVNYAIDKNIRGLIDKAVRDYEAK
jgi:undecaprenyl pyrophosphate synthase